METPVPLPSRNRSLAAGKTDPDLPNRSFRPRLKSLRWVSEPVDQPENYPLGPGALGKPPIRPDVPSRLGVHIRERVWQWVAHNLGIFKEPNVTLSLVNDQARQYLGGVGQGDYFAVWVVTSKLEKAIATFALGPSELQPEISHGDKATQSTSLLSGDFRPLVFIQDGAIQDVSLTGDELKPEVHLDEAAQQSTATGDGSHSPEVNVVEKAQQVAALGNGDFRPLVILDESATQMLETEQGEHFLKFVIQDALEKVVQDLMTGQSEFAAPVFEVIASDKGVISVATTEGLFDLHYPSDDFEGYSNLDIVNGLNGGQNLDVWGGAYVDRANFTGIQADDSFETYTNLADVHGLNQGNWTNDPYVDRTNLAAMQVADAMETYTNLASVNGLIGSVSPYTWPEAYVDRENFPAINVDEDFQSYSVEDPIVATLNGGTGFTGAWVFPTSEIWSLYADEDFQSYTVEDPITVSLGGGSGYVGYTGNWVTSDSINTGYEFLGGGPTDTFEPYTDENPVSSALNAGAGWSGAWVINVATTTASDNFESYADENPVVSTLNGGTGWSGAWATP